MWPALSLFVLALVTGIAGQEPPAVAPGARIDVPASGTTVPMLDIGGRPMVEVRINGQGPFAMILDTGASFTGIDPALAQDLSLPRPADGPDAVRIDELRVGDAVVHGFVAAAFGSMLGRLGGPHPPRGVLSAAAFPGHLLVLDYPGRRVAIRPGALPAADNRRVFEYGRDEELPVIPVRIAGHEYQVHLDSGSPSGVTLPMKYAADLPLAAPPVVVGQARTVAGTFPVEMATVNGSVEIGDYTLDARTIRFSDVRPGSEPPVGNVGAEVLKTFVVTFDAANRRIALDRQ
jgi:hypothetical protein